MNNASRKVAYVAQKGIDCVAAKKQQQLAAAAPAFWWLFW